MAFWHLFHKYRNTNRQNRNSFVNWSHRHLFNYAFRHLLSQKKSPLMTFTYIQLATSLSHWTVSKSITQFNTTEIWYCPPYKAQKCTRAKRKRAMQLYCRAIAREWLAQGLYKMTQGGIWTCDPLVTRQRTTPLSHLYLYQRLRTSSWDSNFDGSLR